MRSACDVNRFCGGWGVLTLGWRAEPMVGWCSLWNSTNLKIYVYPATSIPRHWQTESAGASAQQEEPLGKMEDSSHAPSDASAIDGQACVDTIMSMSSAESWG